jgi:hypothetical protein
MAARSAIASGSGSVDTAAIAAAVAAAVPDVADIETAAETGATAALVSADVATAADVAGISTLLARFPDLQVAEVASVAGAAVAEVVAASPGQQIAVHGWVVNAEAANGGGGLSWWTGNPLDTGSPLRTGAFAPGGQWAQDPVQEQVVFSTATGDPLYFANDGVDAVTARVFYRLVTP